MNNYEELEIIGKGSFGLIRKVRRKQDGKVLVRKEISYKTMSTAQKKQLVTEVNLLRELKHPNIVRYYERIVDKENCIIYIIMEFCEGGDLGNVIKRCKKEGKVVSEDVVWDVLAQILMALEACHSGELTKSGVVLHRDIKPENIFLDSNQMVKLGDFGLSRVLNQHSQNDFASTYVGTPFYMSPELVNEIAYDTKSDIWSLGCVVYELCALQPPFQANSQQALYNKISSGKVQRLPSRYSDDLDMLVKSMLQLNQDLRPSAKDLYAHPRLRQSAKSIEYISRERYLGRKEMELSEMADSLRKKEAWLLERERMLDLREADLGKRELELDLKLRSTSSTENLNPGNGAGTDEDDEDLFKSFSLMNFSPISRSGNKLDKTPRRYSDTQRSPMSKRQEQNVFKFSPSYFPQ
jgi:NIMA (never in mitosis gene a)-related kinase